jgi:predicted RNase H-like HicB family nuclease
MKPYPVSVGLEQGSGSATRVHALELLGCTAQGDDPEAALEEFAGALAEWLDFLMSAAEAVPSPEVELEITVDEWLATEVDVGSGESDACFEADLRPLTDLEINDALRRLGDLRGRLLSGVRRLPEAELDERRGGEWTLRQVLDELARAQWWTLSRLGASPLAEVPARVLGRLDTAMALVVDRFVSLRAEERAAVIDLDGEIWTPRKVLRRLLWLEWSLGQVARRILAPHS